MRDLAMLADKEGLERVREEVMWRCISAVEREISVKVVSGGVGVGVGTFGGEVNVAVGIDLGIVAEVRGGGFC